MNGLAPNNSTIANIVPLTPEMYIEVLSHTEATIAEIEPINLFRERLNKFMEQQGITSGVARAKYMAVMLSTVQNQHGLLLHELDQVKNSQDMVVLLRAIPAMQRAQHLDDVAACLELLLIREVLSLES